MTDFYDHLKATGGNLNRARKNYIRERRWKAEQWYEAWQAGPLAAEVAFAVDRFFWPCRIYEPASRISTNCRHCGGAPGEHP